MSSFLKYFKIIVLFLFLFSCKEEPADKEEAVLTVSTNDLLFGLENTHKDITITSTGEYLVESSAPWCTVDIIPDARDILRVSVEANETVEERTAEIVITYKSLTEKITVKQLAAEPYISAKEAQVAIYEKESLEFSLEIATNMPVIFDLPEWIYAQGNDGQKTYFFIADALGEDISRSGSIIIKPVNTTMHENIVLPVRQAYDRCILRVATYNIYYTSWTSNRKALVNSLIRKYDFDIFGTQEGTKTHLTDITADGNYAYIGISRDGGETGEYSAIVYKPSRFRVLEKGNFWYSETPEVPGKGWDATCCNRICSWGKFLDLLSGREFYFFNSHFDHQGTTARLESAKLLLSRIKSIAGNYPVISTGDYNSTPDSNPVKILLNDGLFKDSYVVSEKPPYGPVGTFNGFSPGNTSRIDYIFVTDHIRVKEYGVLNDRPNGEYPSDHDPVLIIAEIPEH